MINNNFLNNKIKHSKKMESSYLTFLKIRKTRISWMWIPKARILYSGHLKIPFLKSILEFKMYSTRGKTSSPRKQRTSNPRETI